MSHDPRACSLTADVDAWISEANGRHPIELFEALAKNRLSARDQALYSALVAVERTPAPLPQGDGLPLPHPLDAEWRFTDATADSLLARALVATGEGDSILLLGVPTVVLSAARSTADRRFVVRCEDNVVGTALAGILKSDPRFVQEATEGCDAAVVDPPWYPLIQDALLAQAASACRTGAWLFAVAAPTGIRSNGEAERQAALTVAQISGLKLDRQEQGALTYRTPAFEVAAMRAAGLGAWLPDWRRGDLLVFQKRVAARALATPTPVPAFELTLQGVRLRLLAIPAPDARGMAPLAEDEVFPSVSARAPLRGRANLWTSSNRAFVCNPKATLTALQQLAAEHHLWPKGLDPSGSETRDSTSIDPIHAVAEVARIAARDLAHTAVLVGGSSWDRAANDARFLNGSATTFHLALRGTPSSPPF
jgi:hypothetical protein